MLLRSLLKHAVQKPDAVAVIDDRGEQTWRQLLHSAAGVAAAVSRSKANAVGILLPASAAFVSSFYGTLLAGKIVVPINFLMGDREINHIISDSEIDTILTAPPLAARLASIPGVNAIDLAALGTPDAPTVAAAGEIIARVTATPFSGKKIATYLYTSGTSGLPKGVVLTHENIQSDVDAAIAHAQLKGEHNFLGIIPLFHSTGLLATMIAPVTLGACTRYIARFSPVATYKAIRDHKVSVMGAVPSMYGALLRLKDAPAEDFASLYAPISGGEPLPSTVREGFLQKFGKHLMEGYGLTETCGPVCFNAPHSHKPGTVGKAVPNAEIRITDENGQGVPSGQVGEVWLRGPMIMQGYHNLPNETFACLTPDGYFKTGDLGTLDADGFLTITGRKKEMIIVAGEKVYPREVEELIAQHPGVAEVAVLGKKDESRGEIVVAFIVPREGHTLTEDAIRDFCREKGLINWKTPREVFLVPSLPVSPTGKVLKRVLAEQLASAPQ